MSWPALASWWLWERDAFALLTTQHLRNMSLSKAHLPPRQLQAPPKLQPHARRTRGVSVSQSLDARIGDMSVQVNYIVMVALMGMEMQGPHTELFMALWHSGTLNH